MTNVWDRSDFLRYSFLAIVLCLSLFFLASSLPSAGASSEEITVHVYGSAGCSSCEQVKEKLVGVYGSESVVYHPLSEEPNAFYFKKIFSEALPGEEREIPLVGVIREGRLVAVVGGYEERYLNRGFWKSIGSSPPASYYGGENHKIESPDYVRRLVLQKVRPGQVSFGDLIVPVAVAAAADAVNPCAFSLFIVFLTYLVTRLNRGVLKVGGSFVLAVFVVYFFIGLGLRQCLAAFSFLRYGVAVFGAFVGVLQMSDLFLGHGITLTPDAFKERVRAEIGSSSDLACRTCGSSQASGSSRDDLSERIVGGITSPAGAFALGLLTSLLLLPCTSGPYFVAANFISKSAGLGLVLLFIYNSIFVLPFVAILLGVRGMTLETLRVKKWWKEWSQVVGFVAGAAIFILSVFVLFSCL
ncbi:hypothetical protein AKJ41_03015 [candidate division MSBL1 archaeon SCGC-AAA259O05]|uniref:Cytochrome C biogenesis protein transmembrane domain-containing protein n=1 Tax=candidate division MSBL1 archaeon SCGC-AAA259O05 TaxID=1698271 RepID=A0A133V3K9_9EURY|nr:hypothetical protein AKJ41_03015 [candidate division MSBL1 archaeon SCGC-AAA259O05]